MRIRQLHIEKSPGMPSGLPVLQFSSGVTIVLGANASGKSTIARSIRALLWPDEERIDARIKSQWSVGDESVGSELFANQVHWKPALSAPIPPGAASLSRFGIRTLLESADKGDGEVARRVARELAGGLDFAAAERKFARKTRLAGSSSAFGARKVAKQNLTEAQNNAKSLYAKEQELAQLNVEIEEARVAAKQKVAAVALADLVGSYELVRKCESQLDTFEKGLEQLVGDERERIESLTKQLDEQSSEFRELTKERERLEGKHAELSFAGDGPNAQELEAWIVRVEELRTAEVRIDSLSVQREGVKRACEAAGARIVVDGSSDKLDSDSLDALAMKLEGLRKAQSELDAAEQTIIAWDGWAQGEAAVELRSAVESMRTWLRTPSVSVVGGAPSWVRNALFVTAIVLLVLGAIAITSELSASFPPSILFLIGVGIAVLARAVGSTKTANGSDDGARAHAEQAVERLKLAPAKWTTKEVESTLRELEERLTAAEQASRAIYRVREARSAEERAQARTNECKAELLKWATDAGIDASYIELGTALQVQCLVDWGKTNVELERLSGQLEAEQSAYQSKLSEATEWLAPFDAIASDDTAAARAALRTLETRCSELQRCGESLEQVRGQVDRTKTALDVSENELSELWKRTGVERDDQVALIHRLEEFGRWKKERDQLRNAKLELESNTERFERAGELPRMGGSMPATIDLAEAEKWVEELSGNADRLGDLKEEAGGINQLLKSAKEGHILEDAVAATYAADQNIAADRELAIEDALARTLLEEARASHSSEHAPPVLKRAQSFFGQFTHSGFELRLDDSNQFVARDTSAGEDRSLEELSDGTRIQLLLAARLSALEELEISGPLPICLDEALATTDPERFSEIASALFEVADSGRQIIYFTADPSEARQWQQAARALNRDEPALIRLAELKGEAAEWDQTPPSADEATSSIPDPTGKSPEEYAQLLQVPPPDRFAKPSAWHLYHIAFNHLDALATCLNWRVASVGQWRATREANREQSMFAEDVAMDFDHHAELIETLMPLWSVGRGRPVTWKDVEESDAVTDRFADQVRELVRSLGPSPEQFIEAVDSIKGFRTTSKDKLRTHLDSVGCLATEEPYSHQELVRLCLATSDAAKALGPNKAGAYLDWIIGQFGDEAKVEIPRAEPSSKTESLPQHEN